MTIALTILWVVVIVAFIAVPIAMLVWAFFRFRNLLSTAQTQIEGLSELAAQTAKELEENRPATALRGVGAAARSEDILDARKTRMEIARVRAVRKANRLDKAVARWRSYGLVSAAKTEK